LGVRVHVKVMKNTDLATKLGKTLHSMTSPFATADAQKRKIREHDSRRSKNEASVSL